MLIALRSRISPRGDTHRASATHTEEAAMPAGLLGPNARSARFCLISRPVACRRPPPVGVRVGSRLNLNITATHFGEAVMLSSFASARSVGLHCASLMRWPNCRTLGVGMGIGPSRGLPGRLWRPSCECRDLSTKELAKPVSLWLDYLLFGVSCSLAACALLQRTSILPRQICHCIRIILTLAQQAGSRVHCSLSSSTILVSIVLNNTVARAHSSVSIFCNVTLLQWTRLCTLCSWDAKEKLDTTLRSG